MLLTLPPFITPNPDNCLRMAYNITIKQVFMVSLIFKLPRTICKMSNQNKLLYNVRFYIAHDHCLQCSANVLHEIAYIYTWHRVTCSVLPTLFACKQQTQLWQVEMYRDIQAYICHLQKVTGDIWLLKSSKTTAPYWHVLLQTGSTQSLITILVISPLKKVKITCLYDPRNNPNYDSSPLIL